MKPSHHVPGQVNVQVKGNHVTITPRLHDQVVAKMAKLDKYLDRLQTIEVELCWERTRDADHQNRVEATTRVAGRTLRVTASNSDMYAAVDEVVDKLYRQLNRHKERLKSHSASKLAEVLPAAPELPSVGVAESDDEDTEEPVIVRERLEVKPQFEDEAIADMEAAGQSFYVFLNARNESVNVVYRHGDGTYGLIEPQAG
jgi:putative sigma-54 modulation protein